MSALLGLNVADHIKLTLEIVIEKQKKWFKDELEVMKMDTGNWVTEKSFFSSIRRGLISQAVLWIRNDLFRIRIQL